MGWVQAWDQQASVQVSASRIEDSARTAYEELMLEEEQAATKAAAKKAKKLKQKAKKKNKQQAAPAVGDEPTAQPSSGDEEEEDQFRLLQATPPSLELEAALNIPSAEKLPSALRVLHLDTGLPTTAPAANSAAEAPSSSLFSPAQSSRPQEVAQPGAAGGSPGSLYQLLCCPLTKVALECDARHGLLAHHCLSASMIGLSHTSGYN